MADNNKLLPPGNYTDSQFFQIPGPDGTTFGYQFDKETNTFISRESSLVFSGKHGSTHISTDPIPSATCVNPGLLSSTDKCKLDSLIGTRIGVLGFSGSSQPDDGGFMSGDIILAAGNDLITLERVGNVIRLTPEWNLPFQCSETCLNLYWQQDETEANTIRPPTCNGKLPNVSGYGELKFYLFPESQIVSPANPAAVLNRKGNYPTFIFKRYDNGIGVNEGQLDLVLKRNANTTAQIGWAFNPGATGIPECVWYLGLDSSGNQLSFKLSGNTTPGIMGALLYNGSVITKRMGVITGYQSSVVQTNQYKAKYWDPVNHTVLGTEFTVTNMAQFDLTNGITVLDSAQDSLLAIGQIIDLWSIKVGETDAGITYAHYSKERPAINPTNLWTTLGGIQFGDTVEADDPGTGAIVVDDFRTIETDVWGIIGLPDQLELFNTSSTLLPLGHHATIETTSPAGLAVTIDETIADEIQRPVEVWFKSALRDAYLEIHFARPAPTTDHINYPPIDVLIRSPIDSFITKYAFVQNASIFASGVHHGNKYFIISGLEWNELPPRGRIRTIYSPGSATPFGTIIEYYKKLAFPGTSYESDVALVTAGNVTPGAGDIIELLHEDYTTPAVRLKFEYDSPPEIGTGGVKDILMRPMVGTMATKVAYGTFGTVPADDFIGGFEAGYAVGSQAWQVGSAVSATSGITVNPEGFVVYTGASGGAEVYNILKVLVTDQKVWLWWNDLLLPPSTVDSAALDSPVDISTPYFPITDAVQYGKFGVRLWPGSKLRRFIVRSRPTKFSEFTLSQIEIV